jgi:hypothetical protein
MTKKSLPIILGIIFLGLVGYKFYDYKHPKPVVAHPTEQTVSTKDGTATTEPASNPKGSSINVTTEVPINGVYKGVIEVGASGFNSFVINMDANKNWELVSKEFGKSLAYEGFITEEDVKKGLKDYISSISTKGVAGRNIHFVMSSGALKNEKTKLIASAIEKMGYVVNRVTPEQEGKYALKALLPKAYFDNSFVVDIGSGNTKISWYENGKSRTIECSGAKYYQDGKKDADVYNEIVEALQSIPVPKRENCFIIGGVPFQLASKVRTGNERFTLLKPSDFYSAGDDVKLRSGLNIYRGLEDGTKCNTFIFDWDANFTVGFLLNLN